MGPALSEEERDMAATPFLIEDPLHYLPKTGVVEFSPGQIIYGSAAPPEALYLVVQGHVKISRIIEDAPILLRLCGEEEFFGESLFIHATGEQAEALGEVHVMHWPVRMLEELLRSQPNLGVGLIQELTSRAQGLGMRMLSLTMDSVTRRLAKLLLSLAKRDEVSTGSMRRLLYVPHKLLAQYIGTSRELVTHALIDFRDKGIVEYSRREMAVNIPSLEHYLYTTRTVLNTAKTGLHIAKKPMYKTNAARAVGPRGG